MSARAHPAAGQRSHRPASASTMPSTRDRSFRDEALPQMDAVYGFALRLARDPDRAQDLTQDTFLRAYQNWEQYTPGTKAKSWLFTICRNLFLRGQDRSRRHDEIVAEAAEEDPRALSREAPVFMAVRDRDPEGEFWSQVVDEQILEAIEALPDEFRSAVILSDIEELSYEEIAGVLEIPVGTVKSRLFRGRRILQERLYEYAASTGIVGPRSGRSRSPGEGAE